MRSQRRSRSLSNQPDRTRAAEYVRMSTEHQQYSTENQHAAIQRYADAQGLFIVRTFTDAGKSGLGIQGREALQELLRVAVNSGSGRFRLHPSLRRQPLGPLPRRRRSGALRIPMQALRDHCPILRRTLSERHQPDERCHKESQARHGRRVQPRAEYEGLRRPMPACDIGVPTRGHGRLWLATSPPGSVWKSQSGSLRAASGRVYKLSGLFSRRAPSRSWRSSEESMTCSRPFSIDRRRISRLSSLTTRESITP